MPAEALPPREELQERAGGDRLDVVEECLGLRRVHLAAEVELAPKVHASGPPISGEGQAAAGSQEDRLVTVAEEPGRASIAASGIVS